MEIEGFIKFLKVAEQNGNLCLWCLVSREYKFTYRAEIYIVGTGAVVAPLANNSITDNYKIHERSYFDSVLMSDGLVWHVFTS